MIKSFNEVISAGLDIQSFESARRDAFQKSKNNILFASIAAFITLIFAITLGFREFGVGMFLAIIAVIVFLSIWGITDRKIKNKLKIKIFTDLVRVIDTSLTYTLGDKEFSETFKNSGLIKNYYSTNIDDAFRGTINGMKFGIGEVRVEERDDESTRTVFYGPFIYIQTNNTYPYTTIIPTRIEKHLGKTGAMLKRMNLGRMNQTNIRFEFDPEFENMFAVWTTNEGMVGNFINDNVRNFLKQEMNYAKVYMGFRDNFVYFALDSRMNFFKIKLRIPINEQVIHDFYNNFARLYSLLEQIISITYKQ